MVFTLFPKICVSCQKPLKEEPLLCGNCLDEIQITLRFECSVCSREATGCTICQKKSVIQRVLTAFESTDQAKKLLKRAQSLSGHALSNPLANALWVRLISSGCTRFDAVMPVSPFYFNPLQWVKNMKGIPLDNLLARSLAQKLHMKRTFRSIWKLKRRLKPTNKTLSLLIVAASLSEKEMQQWVKSLIKVHPKLQVTFLLGCWK